MLVFYSTFSHLSFLALNFVLRAEMVMMIPLILHMRRFMFLSLYELGSHV